MHKNILIVVAITILFLGTSITSTVAFDNIKINSVPNSYGYTLYVGGAGPGNYTKIQDAIDNASDGDTVFVFNGTYFENIEINKSIRLFGENREKTIIDGDGGIMVVSLILMALVESVTVKGFTIQNGRIGINYDTGINNINSNSIFPNHNHSSSAGFSNNIIINNEIGIIVGWWSENVDLYNNVIMKNKKGVLLEPNTNFNWVFENSIMDNNYGICADYSSFNNIFDNFISSNKNDGISLSNSYSNTITGNTISLNKNNGIYLYSHSEGNSIEKNNIFDNNLGICLDSHCNFNDIEGNNFSNNDWKGILFTSSSGNTIKNNKISNSEHSIIFSNSSNNNVSGNIITENSYGFNINNKSKYNTILGNIISNNHYGMIIGNPILPTLSIGNVIDGSNFNRIIKNNFNKNYQHAIFDGCWKNIWKENYWGRPRILPKIIYGGIFLFPWYNFDWHPAKNPYEI